MTPHAAVIIPHYNDVQRLSRCLAALMPQVTPDIEVVVVDNGSDTPLTALQGTYPDVRIVTELQKGAALARNRGVAETTAQELFFLDSDCVPDPDWIAAALAVAETADIIGGRVSVFDETAPPRSGAQAFETVFAFDNKAYIERKRFSVTANLLTDRSVFEAVGPFRSGLSEDLDWCHRATALGHSLLYDPRIGVGHPTRTNWQALRRKWLRLTEESWQLREGTLRDRAMWAVRAALMPLSVVAHVPKIVTCARLTGLRDRLAALGTLTRLRFVRAGWMLRQAVTPRRQP